MKPINLLVVALVLLLNGSSHNSQTNPAKQSRSPNIIFILADDLGYGDLGSYGQKKIRTPNLDRMAAEGMRFTQFYAGSPVCAPSRCVLMTGKHGGHAFIRDNREVKPEGQWPIPASEVTIAKDIGEKNDVVGKHPDIIKRIEKIMAEQHQLSSLFPIKTLDDVTKR